MRNTKATYFGKVLVPSPVQLKAYQGCSNDNKRGQCCKLIRLRSRSRKRSSYRYRIRGRTCSENTCKGDSWDQNDSTYLLHPAPEKTASEIYSASYWKYLCAQGNSNSWIYYLYSEIVAPCSCCWKWTSSNTSPLSGRDIPLLIWVHHRHPHLN
jgi:hypothetical protein